MADLNSLVVFAKVVEANSFSEAARENGASRVLGGIHFPAAVQAGYQQGEQIGAWTYEHALRPMKVK